MLIWIYLYINHIAIYMCNSLKCLVWAPSTLEAQGWEEGGLRREGSTCLVLFFFLKFQTMVGSLLLSFGIYNHAVFLCIYCLYKTRVGWSTLKCKSLRLKSTETVDYRVTALERIEALQWFSGCTLVKDVSVVFIEQVACARLEVHLSAKWLFHWKGLPLTVLSSVYIM